MHQETGNPIHVIWFRNDLRLIDNPAVHSACRTGARIIALYLFTPAQHKSHHIGNNKLRFTLEQLVSLRASLLDIGVTFAVLKCESYSDGVQALVKFCKQQGASQVFANRETEINEVRRDQAAWDQLAKEQIRFHLSQDQTLLEPGAVLTGSGTPFRVFTAFKRAWLKKVNTMDLTPLPAPPKQKSIPMQSTPCEEILSWVPPQRATQWWPAGTDSAHQRLNLFLSNKIQLYKENRDLPAVDGTSMLSPYLAVGAISIRTCVFSTLQLNHMEWDSGNNGLLTWLNELIWREFYKHLSYLHPDISKGAAFQPKTEQISWSQDSRRLLLWQQGNTGYPLVDAGMRQLNEMGWMHNRLRMVTAMFLTKHLFIHWRLGEAYFMDKLIDADFSANNGGWQWSASTGADAVPYFRVFNPQRQSERFDAQGEFIRRWVPELAELDARQIHNPSPLERQMCGYPAPVVDHKTAVAQVKAAFKDQLN